MKETVVTKPRFDDKPFGLMIHETSVLEKEAEFAAALIERWGMVSAKPDGEDSTGRAKLMLLSPEEVVERACSTTELAFKAFEKRKWIKEVMSVKECEAAAKKLKDRFD